MWYWKTQLFLAYISHCGVGLAAQVLGAVPAAPAHEKAHARLGLEVDDEIGIVLELARAVPRGEGGELQARGQLDQHLLERLAVPGGSTTGTRTGIHRTVELEIGRSSMLITSCRSR